MFNRRKNSRQTLPPLPQCEGDLTSEAATELHNRVVQSVLSEGPEYAAKLLNSVIWTPRNVLVLAAMLGNEVASGLMRSRRALDYAHRPQPEDPVAAATWMLVREFVQKDPDTAMVIARGLAQPRDAEQPTTPPVIGPAVVRHLVGELAAVSGP